MGRRIGCYGQVVEEAVGQDVDLKESIENKYYQAFKKMHESRVNLINSIRRFVETAEADRKQLKLIMDQNNEKSIMDQLRKTELEKSENSTMNEVKIIF